LPGANRLDFALELEFMADSSDTRNDLIYLKQARPYYD
jgi:hypothetical protein